MPSVTVELMTVQNAVGRFFPVFTVRTARRSKRIAFSDVAGADAKAALTMALSPRVREAVWAEVMRNLAFAPAEVSTVKPVQPLYAKKTPRPEVHDAHSEGIRQMYDPSARATLGAGMIPLTGMSPELQGMGQVEISGQVASGGFDAVANAPVAESRMSLSKAQTAAQLSRELRFPDFKAFVEAVRARGLPPPGHPNARVTDELRAAMMRSTARPVVKAG